MKDYIVWSRDENNLKRSSSGGIFYELAKEMISHGGAVVGVVMDSMIAKYVFATNMLDVKVMQGSKYIRAILNPQIIEYMENSKGKILFIGLPCQLKEVKKIFRNKDNIIYIELRCHGVIKQDIFDTYIKKHHPNAKNIKFRDKSNGWRNSTKLCVDGKCYKSKLIKDYIQGKNLRGQCIHCKQKGYGDIILGDYWECPEFLENKKGTSRLSILSTNGQRFFDSMKDNIEYKEHPQNKIAIMGGMTVSNNGTLMMTQNFIRYMHKKNNDIGFTLLEYEKGDAGKEVMERSLPKNITDKLDYGFHSAWDLLDGYKLLGYLKSIKWRGQSNLEKQIRDCKTVVYLGGDHFVGKAILRNRVLWTMRMLFTYWDFRNIKRAEKKLYLVSQTMGQFPFYLRPFAKWAFSKADKIYCRDKFSMTEMHKLGLTNISLCYDLAFLPLYNESYYIGEHKSKFTVLIISDLWRKYCATKNEFIGELAYIANALNKITGLPVYLMAHSDNQTMDYRSGEGMLIKEIELKTRNKNVTILPNTTPLLQRAILGGSQLNVSLRMHASISSLEQGVLVIPIAYSSKFKAMYSDLKLDGLVVNELDAYKVFKKITVIWYKRKAITSCIKTRLKFCRVQQLALKSILEIAEDIKNV